MSDCTQFLIDHGFEPSSVGGLYFSDVFEEVVYLLSSKTPEEDIKKDIPGIIDEYACEFYEVNPVRFYEELLKYQKDHHPNEECESLEDELLRLGKQYFVQQQRNDEKNHKCVSM